MKKYQKRVIFEERSYLWRSVIFGSVCENTWNKYRTFLNLNFCSYLGRCLYNIYWEKSERINKKQLRRYSITPSCRILKLFATTNAPPSSSRKYHVELGNHCLKTIFRKIIFLGGMKKFWETLNEGFSSNYVSIKYSFPSGFRFKY